MEHTKTYSIYNDLKTPNTSPKFTKKTIQKSSEPLQENDNTRSTPLLSSVKIDN
jgi:hypothetical protein